MPDIPLVIRNKPHNNQLCTDLFRFISAYPVVSHFLRFAWQTTIADSTTGENAVGHLTSDVIMGGNSFTTVRDENKGVIEARIKELNATVS